jgi:hypothetical protein
MGRQYSATTSRIIWLFLFVVLTSITALLGREAYLASTSKHWPVTDGVVTAFHETPHYRYTVGGSNHLGSHVSCNEFFDHFLSARNSEKYSVRYPLDAKVTVHYHPRKPQLAVLETEFDPSVLKVVAVLLLLCLLCAVGFYRGWRFRSGRGRIR